PTASSPYAGVAQRQSNGFVNRRLRVRIPSPASCGQMSEWLKETGCKLVGASLRWFESSSAQASCIPPLAKNRNIFGGSVIKKHKIEPYVIRRGNRKNCIGVAPM